jgi:hypothetical protein
LGAKEVIGHAATKGGSQAFTARALHEHDQDHEKTKGNVNYEEKRNNYRHEKGRI